MGVPVPIDESGQKPPSRLRPWIGPALAAVVFVAAILLLRAELKHHTWSEILAAIAAVPKSHIALALALTALNYLILSGYDGLALVYLKHPLRLSQIAMGSFVGYAMSHNLGWMLGGTTTRYRMYSSWGFSAVEVVKMFGILGVSFWTGYCFLAGLAFLLDPLEIPQQLHLPLHSTFWLGPLLLGMLAAYLTACAIGRPLAVRGLVLQLPRLWLALGQMAVATCDLLLASAVLYVLLPADIHISYGRFVNVVLLAWATAIVSHVPGGAGVLELMIVKLTNPSDPTPLIGVSHSSRPV